MIRRRAHALAVAALLAAAAVLLAACGGKGDTMTTKGPHHTITVMLDYLPNADHAPLYAAQATGAFAAAGLDVKLVTPSDPSAPLKLVAARKVDLAISYEPELLLARDKGLRVASVGALVQKPLTSIISLKGKVATPQDLRGKRVGTAGIPYQAAYLDTIAKAAGVPPSSVHRIDVGFNLVPSLLSKKIDATLGAFWNVEGVQLQRQGRKPTIIRMEQAGVPTYQELVFVGQMDALRTNGTVIRRFLQAVAEGAKALKKDPNLGADALVKANPDLDHDLQLAQIKATMPVFFPDNGAFPWGYQNADEWKAYGQWLLQQGLVRRLPTPTSLTNEYLPGRGI